MILAHHEALAALAGGGLALAAAAVDVVHGMATRLLGRRRR